MHPQLYRSNYRYLISPVLLTLKTILRHQCRGFAVVVCPSPHVRYILSHYTTCLALTNMWVCDIWIQLQTSVFLAEKKNVLWSHKGRWVWAGRGRDGKLIINMLVMTLITGMRRELSKFEHQDVLRDCAKQLHILYHLFPRALITDIICLVYREFRKF